MVGGCGGGWGVHWSLTNIGQGCNVCKNDIRDVGSIDDFLTFRLFADFVEFANFVFL